MMTTTQATNISAPAIPLTEDQKQEKLLAFIYAVEEGNNDACLRIIKKWAQDGHIQAMLEVKSGSCSWTALHYAAAYGRTEIAQALLTFGVKHEVPAETMLNATDNDGVPVLHRAAAWGQTETLGALLAFGVEQGLPAETMLMAEDDNGQTALHRAAAWEETETFKALLDAGEKANILEKMLKHTDHEKRTVFDIDYDDNEVEIKTALKDAALKVALKAVSKEDQFDKISQDPDLKNACASHAIMFVKGEIAEKALLERLDLEVERQINRFREQIVGLEGRISDLSNLGVSFKDAVHAQKHDADAPAAGSTSTTLPQEQDLSTGVGNTPPAVKPPACGR